MMHEPTDLTGDSLPCAAKQQYTAIPDTDYASKGRIDMKKAFALLLSLLVALSFAPTQGYAASSQGYLFAAEMIPTANQIDAVGYYHVPGIPGETITLQAKLTNLSDQSIEIKAVPMNAYSAQDGIFYQNPQEVNMQLYTLVDDQYGMAQYMTVTSPIALSAYQTESVTFSVAVPNLDTGTILGSIRFVTFAGTDALQGKGEKNGNAMMLIDKYQAIDTAIQIDLPQQVKASFTMGDPILSGDKITIKISNVAAVIQGNLSGTYEIRDRKTTVLYSGTILPFKMAPMSAFLFPLAWKHQELEAGTYTISIKLNVDDKVIVFYRAFAIYG